jgi:hypothetical protein
MLDFRYHVTSLVAVFLALIVGIVVGVGISGRGFVDKSERQKFENRIDKLQARVDDLSRDNDTLRERQQMGSAFMTDAYPVLMQNRLAGKRIAVIAVGAGGDEAGSDVARALSDAGATSVRYRALKLPIVAATVRGALRTYQGSPLLTDVAHELGQEWATGGKTPVADRLSSVIVEEQRGTNGAAADGVVVVQDEEPRGSATRRCLDGFYSGLGASGVPVVGVEESGRLVSTIPVFDRYSGFSTVDDIETPSGRLALALLLGGAPAGNYGVKTTATAPLPKIPPTPTPGA